MKAGATIDGGDPLRPYLEDGWRVLVLREDEPERPVREVRLTPEGAMIETSPGLWARLFPDG